jgi:hypothetical protein
MCGWPQHLQQLQTYIAKLPNLQPVVFGNQKYFAGEPVGADEVSLPIQ